MAIKHPIILIWSSNGLNEINIVEEKISKKDKNNNVKKIDLDLIFTISILF